MRHTGGALSPDSLQMSSTNKNKNNQLSSCLPFLMRLQFFGRAAGGTVAPLLERLYRLMTPLYSYTSVGSKCSNCPF